MRRQNHYLVLAFLLFLAGLPIISLVFIGAFSPSADWSHLLTYVLPGTARDTLLLLFLTGIGATLIGCGTAWLTVLCDFPGRRVFAWLLVLPLSVPPYLAAYAYVEFLDFSGPVQSALRGMFGWTSARDYWFPDISSLPGASIVFSLVLFPYVYLPVRLLFAVRGAGALDMARSLGASPRAVFWKVGIPMARPAIVAGLVLVLLECLNDIGAVEHLGVRTVTLAIFDIWLNRDNLGGAAQLSIMVLVLIGFLVWLERATRAPGHEKSSRNTNPPALISLGRRGKVLAWIGCALPVVCGLGIPFWVMGTYASRRLEQLTDSALIEATIASIQVAGFTAFATVCIAFFSLLLFRARQDNRAIRAGQISSVGYAVPGTILAIGVLVPLAGLDNWLDGWMRSNFGISTGLLFSGSMIVLIYACSTRFMAIAWNNLNSGFERISETVDHAARSLGRNARTVALEIHTPIMVPALSAAFLLVFVETMKELSATLLLRPFGFQTLATHIYEQASQAAVEDAAWASLLIVLVGIVPVITLTRLADRRS